MGPWPKPVLSEHSQHDHNRQHMSPVFTEHVPSTGQGLYKAHVSMTTVNRKDGTATSEFCACSNAVLSPWHLPVVLSAEGGSCHPHLIQGKMS